MLDAAGRLLSSLHLKRNTQIEIFFLDSLNGNIVRYFKEFFKLKNPSKMCRNPCLIDKGKSVKQRSNVWDGALGNWWLENFHFEKTERFFWPRISVLKNSYSAFF